MGMDSSTQIQQLTGMQGGAARRTRFLQGQTGLHAFQRLRQLAALGSGLLCNPKLAGDLTGLMADLVAQVRAAACLAMAAYGGKSASEILPQVLTHGEETLQLAAAEALSAAASRGPIASINAIASRASASRPAITDACARPTSAAGAAVQSRH